MFPQVPIEPNLLGNLVNVVLKEEGEEVGVIVQLDKDVIAMGFKEVITQKQQG